MEGVRKVGESPGRGMGVQASRSRTESCTQVCRSVGRCGEVEG